MTETAQPTRRASRIDKLIFVVIGLACYAWVLRFQGISPSNTNWLIRDDMQPPIGNDPTQHYLGWEFFRGGSLTAWPPGRSTQLGPGDGASIALTDSLSLVAIPLRFILRAAGHDAPFQYLGLWMLANFLLQSLFAGLLLSRFCRWRTSAYGGAVLFGLAPIFVYRLGYNVVHSSQWVILAAIYLVASGGNERGKWMLLSALATAINPYLTAMVFIVFFAQHTVSWWDARHVSLKSVLDVAAVLASILVASYLAGLFVYRGGTLSAHGFGDYSANLLSLVDPVIESRLALSPSWSEFGLMPNSPDGRAYQWEGFGYLGTGVLITIAIAVLGHIKRLALRQAWWVVTITVGIAATTLADAPPLAVIMLVAIAGLLVGFLNQLRSSQDRTAQSLTLAALVSMIIALSNQIFFGSARYKFFTPQLLLDLFGFIRVSGRLIWVPVYVVMLASLVMLERVTEKKIFVAITLCLIVPLQIADGHKGYAAIRDFMSGPRTTLQLSAPLWDDIASSYRHIEFVTPGQRPFLDNVPAGQDQSNYSDDFWFAERQLWADLGEFAVKNKLTLNAFYFARNPARQYKLASAAQTAMVATNRYRDDTLYVFIDAPLWNQAKAIHRQTDAIGLLNGVPILAPGLTNCTSCSLTDLVPVRPVTN